MLAKETNVYVSMSHFCLRPNMGLFQNLAFMIIVK